MSRRSLCSALWLTALALCSVRCGSSSGAATSTESFPDGGATIESGSGSGASGSGSSGGSGGTGSGSGAPGTEAGATSASGSGSGAGVGSGGGGAAGPQSVLQRGNDVFRRATFMEPGLSLSQVPMMKPDTTFNGNATFPMNGNTENQGTASVLYLEQGPAQAGCPVGAVGCMATARVANAGLF